MAKDPRRREEWTEAATDYAQDHGLIDLSLRPLAAALGTSDRMLLYHFGTKDQLVAEILSASNDRAVEAIRSLPPSSGLRRAVHDLWAAMQQPSVQPCTRLYVEAAALGLLGREPYVSVVRRANTRWVEALRSHLVRSGVDRRRAGRAVGVMYASFLGFQLDLPLDVDEKARQRVVADLARSVEALG